MSNLQKSLFKKPPLNPPNYLSASPDGEVVDSDNSNVDAQISTKQSNSNRFHSADLMYEPVSFSEFMKEDSIELDGDVFAIYTIENPQPTPWFIFHHGAGHSAATWALCCKELNRLANGKISFLAFDCRGHGKTKTSNDSDFSLATLSTDLVRLVTSYFKEIPRLTLIGHSMGGPIVVEASKELKQWTESLAVLDVVEGSAMESVKYMESVIEATPSSFPTLEAAIQWRLENPESARISIPPQLISKNDGYVWRVDLVATKKYWNGWFEGMSKKFLSVPTPKLLLVAGSDRLDKDLMIGQMQGRFTYKILPNVGHCLQEDAPESTAGVLMQFFDRNHIKIKPFNVK